MGNYREKQVTAYQRAKRVEINNPLGATAGIVFNEEQVIFTEGEAVHRDAGILTADMTDPATRFDLLHPDTDAVLGSMTYQDLYVALYSLYRYLAAQRDAAPVVTE